MIKARLQKLIADAFGQLPYSSDAQNDRLLAYTIEECKPGSHGDFYSAVALRLACSYGLSPQQLADELVTHMSGSAVQASCLDGFINFRLGTDCLAEVIRTIVISDIVLPVQSDIKAPALNDCDHRLQLLYARAAAAIRQAMQPAVSQEGILPPTITQQHWHTFIGDSSLASWRTLFNQPEAQFARQKQLIVLLDRLSEIPLEQTSDKQKVWHRHMQDLGLQANSIAELWQVRGIAEELALARLGLIEAVKKVAGRLLGIKKQAAPDWL